jgi:hypothetical protein
MGFKPSLALLHKAQAQRAARADFHAAQVTRKLSAEQRFTGTSKRQAKQDKQSLHKARAWHYSLPHINTILRATKQSRITWI